MANEWAWTTVKTTDGKEYYYNTETKITQWEKPADALSLFVLSQPWRVHKAGDGREYYHNVDTAVTTWEAPEGFKERLAQVDGQARAPNAPPINAPQAPSANRYNDDRNDFDRRYPEQTRRIEYPQGETLRTSFAPAASNNEPEYATYAEGEAAFFKMLKRCNAQPDWSWEETMRATIKDAQFRALKDPAERKSAWAKWIIELRAQDKEKEKERLAKLRQDFLNMLKSHPEIKHYTRWKTARPYIEGETIFRSASDDTERRQLFEDYISELKKAHNQHETAQHKAAVEDLVNILHSLEFAPYTRWTDARTAIESNEQFQQDDKFKTLTKIDVLTAFDEHIRVLERKYYNDRNIKTAEKFRRDRKARDDFKALLKDIVAAGKFKAGSKWRDIYPLIEDDPRYQSAFSEGGSSPLDLFWDQLEDLERDLRVKRNAVLDILDEKEFEMTVQTSLDEFTTVIQNDSRTDDMTADDISLTFDRLHEKCVKRAEDSKNQAERRKRKAIDALRSEIRHLEPPVRVTDSWEDVRARIERSEAYEAVEAEEDRLAAFEKVIKRLEEKEKEYAEKEAEEKKRDREHRDHRDRERERERESRTNGHRRRDERAYSRTPELDTYEVDRRRAAADRERRYRRGSATGLSPPPAVHGRRRGDSRELSPDRRSRVYRGDRYRGGSREGDIDSRDGRLSSSIYDIERQSRAVERERAHYSRADPREFARALDYGEDDAGSMTGGGDSAGARKTARSSEEPRGQRDSKRRKTDGSKSPVVDTPMAEAVELQSGSEEGEIEEVEVKAEGKIEVAE